MMPIAEPELDLPLADTPSSRFLTWIMGGLIGLGVLAFAVAAGADVSIRRLAAAPRLVTIALPSISDTAREAVRTAQALSLLRALPGVAHATPVASEELDKLVEPWLGDRAGQPGLPMPRLIDIGFNPGVEPDLERLRQVLTPIAASVQIEELNASPGGGMEVARALRLMAGLIGAAILAFILIIVAVVTRQSLGQHADAVDLLRLMGAQDRYVARQFEQHALASALRGGLAGFVAGLILVIAFILISILLPSFGLPGLELRAVHWVLLTVVPVLGALLTALGARLAAVHGLLRLR